MKCTKGPEVASGPDVVRRLLAGSGLFPSISIMFIRLRTTSRSEKKNNHCIRSLACCISIVPHLIAYFDLRQLL